MTNVELWRQRERERERERGGGRDNSIKSETNSDSVYEDRNETANNQEK